MTIIVKFITQYQHYIFISENIIKLGLQSTYKQINCLAVASFPANCMTLESTQSIKQNNPSNHKSV